MSTPRVGAVEAAARGGGDEVGGELLLEARDQVEAGERLDRHQVVDHRRGQRGGGERRVEDLGQAEDHIRLDAAELLVTVAGEAVLEVVEALLQPLDDGLALGHVLGEDERPQLLLLEVILDAVDGVLDGVDLCRFLGPGVCVPWLSSDFRILEQA